MENLDIAVERGAEAKQLSAVEQRQCFVDSIVRRMGNLPELSRARLKKIRAYEPIVRDTLKKILQTAYKHDPVIAIAHDELLKELTNIGDIETSLAEYDKLKPHDLLNRHGQIDINAPARLCEPITESLRHGQTCLGAMKKRVELIEDRLGFLMKIEAEQAAMFGPKEKIDAAMVIPPNPKAKRQEDVVDFEPRA